MPELVPRADLKGAVALNSLGINIARSIGPALGGFLLAGLGAAAVYGIDVLSYVVVSAALLWWRRDAGADDGLREQFGGALRAGLRYARASRDLHRVLWRAGLFFAFASAVWALLPIVARQEIGGGPGFYGLMLGSVGAGAIAGRRPAAAGPRPPRPGPAGAGGHSLVTAGRDHPPGADELRGRSASSRPSCSAPPGSRC